ARAGGPTARAGRRRLDALLGACLGVVDGPGVVRVGQVWDDLQHFEAGRLGQGADVEGVFLGEVIDEQGIQRPGGGRLVWVGPHEQGHAVLALDKDPGGAAAGHRRSAGRSGRAHEATRCRATSSATPIASASVPADAIRDPPSMASNPSMASWTMTVSARAERHTSRVVSRTTRLASSADTRR